MAASAFPPSPPTKEPLSERFTAAELAPKIPFESVAFVLQSISIVLLFVGGLIAVTVGVYPPSCAATGCSAGALTIVGYGLMASRILIVLGLFGIAVGNGMHLEFDPPPRAAATPQDVSAYNARRWMGIVLEIFLFTLLIIVVIWAAGGAL
jgi:succinate dehydrogenase/fumarate reductase cytochrome b subunit